MGVFILHDKYQSSKYLPVEGLSDHQVTQTSSQITLPKILLSLWSWSYTVLLTILEGESKRFFFPGQETLTKYKYVLKMADRAKENSLL